MHATHQASLSEFRALPLAREGANCTPSPSTDITADPEEVANLQPLSTYATQTLVTLQSNVELVKVQLQ
jgi:hypothetical protein